MEKVRGSKKLPSEHIGVQVSMVHDNHNCFSLPLHGNGEHGCESSRGGLPLLFQLETENGTKEENLVSTDLQRKHQATFH